jgi:quercetin dioxygenase-like cupin family protein
MIKHALVGAAILAACFVGSGHAQDMPQTAGIKRTLLQKVDLPGTNFEVIFGIAEFQPNVTVERHTHPGPMLFYISEGEFLISIDGQSEKAIKTGESFQVPANTAHVERTGAKGAKALATYIVQKGQPIASSAK